MLYPKGGLQGVWQAAAGQPMLIEPSGIASHSTTLGDLMGHRYVKVWL